MVKDRTIKIKGAQLFSYQRDVADKLLERGAGKIVCCVSRRQVGKTTLISSLMMFYAFNFAGSRNYVVSLTLNQAKNCYNQIINTITKDGKFLIKKSNATDLEIELINGSSIKFLSAAMGDRLRGYNSNGLVALDEVAFFNDDIISLVLPYVDFYKANLLMVSTPFVRDGFFYKYVQMGLDGKNGVETVLWTDPKYKADLDRILHPERLEMYRSQLSDSQFKTEYLGEWLEEGMVFSGFKKLVKENTIEKDSRLYVGIDWSLGVDNDDTVVTMIDGKGHQVFIDAWNNLTPTQGVERVVKDIAPYFGQIRLIRPELNSLGSVYTDMLRNSLPSNVSSLVSGFETTNDSKNVIVTNLQQAFEKESINLFTSDKQLRQLSSYAMEITKNRKISYNGAGGTHDDMVIALMLAWDAYLNANATGVYSISSIR